eukprot:650536-Prymnesium_polylepis.1
MQRYCGPATETNWSSSSASCFNPGVTNPASPSFGRCTGQRLKGAIPRAKGVTMPRRRRARWMAEGLLGVLVAGLASFPLSRRLRSRRPRHLTSWQANR